MELRFTSGQICKIFGITKQTLLFYDKAGIIKPRYQDPDNRYRYYTLAQFDLLYLILSLRETGISLSEIKGLLAQRTVDHTIAILERQMGEIQNKIDSLQIAKGRLDKNLTQIKAIGGLKQDMLDIAYLPEQHLLAMPVQYANGSVDYDLTVSKLIAHMAACAIPFY